MLVTDDIQKLDDVRSAEQVLQNFNLSPDLLLLYRLQNLDDTSKIVSTISLE